MQKQKIILDVDPGVDDSVALIYAFLNKEFDIKLLGVVGGNVGIKQCVKNALFITENFATYPIPVVEGASQPIKYPFSHNLSVHGKTGLGDIIKATKTKLKTINKPDYGVCEAYRDVIVSNPNEVKIVCVGPSTNLALTLQKYPEIVPLIKEVIIMGGSIKGTGSITPYASFNVYYDPESLRIILKSGLKKIVFSPTELGINTYVTNELTDKLEKMNRYGKMVKQLYCGYHDLLLPSDKLATHDLCAVMFLAKPNYFEVKPVNLKLQLGKGKKRGQTLFTPAENSSLWLVTKGERNKILSELERKIKSAT